MSETTIPIVAVEDPSITINRLETLLTQKDLEIKKLTEEFSKHISQRENIIAVMKIEVRELNNAINSLSGILAKRL